jgi:hypothetical protein
MSVSYRRLSGYCALKILWAKVNLIDISNSTKWLSWYF